MMAAKAKGTEKDEARYPLPYLSVQWDGSYMGDKLAGVGLCIQQLYVSGRRHTVAELGVPVLSYSSTRTEAQGLLLAAWILRCCFTTHKVQMVGDNKSVVDILNGGAKTKDPYIKDYIDLTIDTLGSHLLKVTWAPTSNNKVCNKLARRAAAKQIILGLDTVGDPDLRS